MDDKNRLNLHTFGFFGKENIKSVNVLDIISTDSTKPSYIIFKIRGDRLFYLIDKKGTIINNDILSTALLGIHND